MQAYNNVTRIRFEVRLGCHEVKLGSQKKTTLWAISTPKPIDSSTNWDHNHQVFMREVQRRREDLLSDLLVLELIFSKDYPKPVSTI